jgi:hexosaminidase
VNSEPPAGQLRFASTNTTNFTASLISSISARFPGKYFSTGGDEINTECYAIDEPTQADLNATGKTLLQALNTFTQSTHEVLEKSGKTPIVWEEMVLSFNVTLSNNTIVMVWISSADAAAVAEQGYRLVQAPSDYFYLDCGGGGWVGDNPSGNSWCDPFKTWQHAYSFDPVANMTDTQAKFVIGGEQLLWTEQSHHSNLDPIVWPRAAASAELFWTGPGGNISTALPRLHDVAFRMTQRGIGAIALQPLWCALRPGVCDLTA